MRPLPADRAPRPASLSGRLGRLLTAAVLAAAVVFVVLYGLSVMLLDRYAWDEARLARERSQQVENLQDYVDRNGVSSSDIALLTRWVRQQGVLSLQVYRQGALVYDSALQQQDYDGLAGDELPSWETPYPVTFADGEAEILLEGSYAYRLYTYALVAELAAAFALFFGIVMAGIRRTIRYIRQLSGEIRILEGGGLDYKVTVQGTDELGQLARGLDDMRLAFQRQQQQEKALAQASQRMVTEMSHDLRTPLTAILLYTQLLLDHRYQTAEQQNDYVRRIDKQARRLKQLSDRLFSYALSTAGEDEAPAQALPLQSALYDLLSETTAYLEQQGFAVRLDLDWRPCRIRLRSDYLGRIFDNLASNIVKYADPAAPVVLRSLYTDGCAGIALENRCAARPAAAESSGIGLRNVDGMMRKMGGSCVVEQSGGRFCAALYFACADAPEQGKKSGGAP